MTKKTKPRLRCNCRVKPYISRTCERGTNGCVVRHKQPKNLLPTLLPAEVESWKAPDWNNPQPEPLFGNHIRETWEVIKSCFKPAGTVRFTKRSVKAYLDRCIVNWRAEFEIAKTLEDGIIAQTYEAALQSVREDVFGEKLPDKKLK